MRLLFIFLIGKASLLFSIGKASGYLMCYSDYFKRLSDALKSRSLSFISFVCGENEC